MRAILSFNLPKEQEEYDACVHGQDYLSMLKLLDELLHRHIKDEKFKTPEQAMEWVREQIEL